jgi:hypothetical protein
MTIGAISVVNCHVPGIWLHLLPISLTLAKDARI